MYTASYTSNQPSGLSAILSKGFQSFSSFLSVEKITVKTFSKLLRNYKEILEDLRDFNSDISTSEIEDLRKYRDLLPHFVEILELLTSKLDGVIKEGKVSPRLLGLLKEYHTVVLEILDTVDEIMVSIDLLSDEDLPKALKEFDSGTFTSFIKA